LSVASLSITVMAFSQSRARSGPKAGRIVRILPDGDGKRVVALGNDARPVMEKTPDP
jgi:hypothetical protein